jgi:hypothetical protein
VEVIFPENICISSFGCGWNYSFAVAANGALYLWGEGAKDPSGKNVHSPMKVENFICQTPSQHRWADIFSWLFLGREDKRSKFHNLPKEIIFHFVSVI